MFRLRYKILISFAILAGLVFSKLINIIFGHFPKTLAAAAFAENRSWPFFDIQNNVFINSKTPLYVYFKSRKFEETIRVRKSND